MTDNLGLLTTLNLLLLLRLPFWNERALQGNKQLAFLLLMPAALLILLQWDLTTLLLLVLLEAHTITIFAAERKGTTQHLHLRIWMLPITALLLLLTQAFTGPAITSDAWEWLCHAAETLPLAGTILQRLPHGHFLVYTAALLAISNEPNMLARQVLDKLPLPSGNDHLFRAGKLIGLLERWLLLAAFIAGSYESIAIIIGLKGLARFKELDTQNFAEYFLIGTLISLTSVIAIGIPLKLLLNQ